MVIVFAAWWLGTHRLDRFWLPAAPLVCLLAGLGWDFLESGGGAIAVAMRLLAGASIFFNLLFCTTSIVGWNAWLENLDHAAARTHAHTAAGWAESLAAPGSKWLFVGEPQAFYFRRPVLYNTVFDESWWEKIAKDAQPEEVRGRLQRLGVTHILVDWTWIQRYRSPGNYGYSTFVVPASFERLVSDGVLQREHALPRAPEEDWSFEGAVNKCEVFRVIRGCGAGAASES